MQRKASHFTFEIKEDNGGFVIEGYGSVFGNVDSYGDIVEKGAFRKSIAARQPKMLWQHKSDVPVGVWDVIREDDKGLYLKGRFADTQTGREARELAKMGAISGLSIGFMTVDSEFDKKKNIRYLKEVDLYEISLVTFPANEEAAITAVKNKPATVREFEHFLRDAGFSRNEAKTIALHGFKAQPTQCDADEARELRDSIATLTSKLRDTHAGRNQISSR